MPASPRKPAASGLRADPALLVLRRFRLVFDAVKRHFRAVEGKAGISGAQVWALSVVAEHPGIGVNELSQAMHVHQSTASNLLRLLMAAGLVASKRAALDRRAVQLTATREGQKVLARAPAPLTGLLPDALGRLDAATLRRLDRDLGRLIAQLGADPRAETRLIGAAEPAQRTAAAGRPVARRKTASR